KRQYIKLGVVGLLLQLGSCKPNLDLSNPQELSTDTYYKTADQLEKSVIPAYQALIGRTQGGYARSLYYALLAPGDDYTHTFKWEPMYQDTYNTPASDGMLALSWKDFWNGVFAANVAIDRISKFTGEIEENRKNRLLGEAYFLRG